MKKKTFSIAVGVAAAVIGFSASGVASASAVHGDYTVPGGTQWVKVSIPASHGPLTFFSVGYTDLYVHQDPIPAADNAREIDNYTGQNPDTGAKFDGCNNRHQPDQLSTTDKDSNGLLGQPLTSLHHGVTITIKPVGSGPNFLWCHYEHGPETWVKLTWKDGSTTEIYWAVPTRFDEITLTRAGTAVAVTPSAPDE